MTKISTIDRRLTNLHNSYQLVSKYLCSKLADDRIRIHFRMTSEEIAGDTSYLARLLRAPFTNAKEFELELQTIHNTLKVQIDAASTLKMQWTHIKDENSFRSSTPGEKS